ncbi:MAG: vitamin B12 transporter, partial [Ancylomarina sp.]
MKLKFLFVLLGSFISLNSWSQTVGVDTIQINTVDILAPRLKHFSEVEKHQEIDSLTLVRYGSQDLATLLQKVSLVNMSSNGSLGALSTVGIRGASATHTSVNWNGIPVNSLTTGSADLSLISAGAFDNVEVVFGAPGSLYGSGTYGGAINLSNIPSWKKRSRLNFISEYGSFSNSKQSLVGAYSNKWISYSGQVFYRYGKNDFKYDDIYDHGFPREKLNHNENKDYGLIQ